MLKFTQTHGLEGIVAKRADSSYQPGRRTGVWSKYRFNRSQEFVIGGYVPSHLGIDSLVIGVYRGKNLYYAARVRAGFNPATRWQVFEAIQYLISTKCPFVNLPEKEPGRWGEGLTAEKMKECVWLKPEAVAEIEFLEWTGADHQITCVTQNSSGCAMTRIVVRWYGKHSRKPNSYPRLLRGHSKPIKQS
jgi:bifunctional non-homologous end joining protein LigD